MREFYYKGVRFVISESNDNYRVSTYYDKFDKDCYIGLFPTLAKCKESAKKFVNNGGWVNWCN